MNLKKIIIVTLMSTAVVASCSDDSQPEKPQSQGQFSFNNLDLKASRLYLTRQSIEDFRLYRMYTITDGIYRVGNIVESTYRITLLIGVPKDSVFSIGEFPTFQNWGQVPEDGRCAAVILDSHNDNGQIRYTTPMGMLNGVPVILSGGMEPGDRITFQFSGELTHTYTENSVEKQESVTGSFSFQGKIEDVRPK